MGYYSIKKLSLQYYPEHFGNIVVELISDIIILRFIYDRGDIYVEKRTIETKYLISSQVAYNHSIPHNEIYELLFKAIKEVIQDKVVVTCNN